jgi:hypothetical protein
MAIYSGGFIEDFMVLIIMTYQVFYWHDIKLMREEKEVVSSLWHGAKPRIKRNETHIVNQIVSSERGYFTMTSLYLITLVSLENSEIKFFTERGYFIQLQSWCDLLENNVMKLTTVNRLTETYACERIQSLHRCFPWPVASVVAPHGK